MRQAPHNRSCFPFLRRVIGFAVVRAVTVALLSLGFALGPHRAQADMPAMLQDMQGCVVEGFLLHSPTSYSPLTYLDKVDWSKFEGRTVRYKRRVARAYDQLVTPPSAVGPCDPALVAVALPRALAQRAENELVAKEYEKALASIRRAIELAPQNCELVATRVFILERVGRDKEADAEAVRAAGMTCTHALYDQRLRLLRDRYRQ